MKGRELELAALRLRLNPLATPARCDLVAMVRNLCITLRRLLPKPLRAAGGHRAVMVLLPPAMLGLLWLVNLYRLLYRLRVLWKTRTGVRISIWAYTNRKKGQKYRWQAGGDSGCPSHLDSERCSGAASCTHHDPDPGAVERWGGNGLCPRQFNRGL